MSEGESNPMTGSDDNAPDLLREALDTAEGVLINLESSLDHSTVEWAEVVTALKRVRRARAALASPSPENVTPDVETFTAPDGTLFAEYAERELARICTCPHGSAGNRTDTDPACCVHTAEYARLHNDEPTAGDPT